MQRHKGAYGYFSGDRFASIGDPEDSDRRNRPESRPLRHTDADQDSFDAGSRNGAPAGSTRLGAKPSDGDGYHNKEWAAKMREVGLIPTDTGAARRQGNRPEGDAHHRGGRPLR